MSGEILRFLRRSFLALAGAAILAAVPVVSSASDRQTAGVALGDCADAAVAMVRNYSSSARPSNPAQKSCEGGRIQMHVQAERGFGYRIMDPVHVTVLLSVDPSVVLDLQSLSRGTIAFNGQEFDLVSPLALNAGESPVDVEARRLRDGRTLVKIELSVQSAVPAALAPYLVFRLDLRYALGVIRDAQGDATTTPDWRVLSTPPIAVTMSPTARPGDAFLETDSEPVDMVRPWPMLALLVGGIFLILLGPGVTIVGWLNRIRPGRKVPANEIAWRSLSKTFADGERHGFSPAHYRAIASTVRKYLNVSAATREELRSSLSTHRQLAEILRVLGQCDAVLYEGKVLAGQEIIELVKDVEAIIARP